MRLGRVAFAIVLGCCATAQAEENVFIDLSVLDGLNGAYTAPREPLFPVLPKQQKTISHKAKKPVVKKQAPAKAKPEPIKVQPQEVAKPIQDLPEVKPIEEPEIVVVDVEPAAPASPVLAQPAKETVSESETEGKVVSSQTSETVAAEAPVLANVSEQHDDVLTNAAEPIVENGLEQPSEEEAPKEDIEKPGLLIDEQSSEAKEPVAAELSSEDRSIVFADGKDELTAEQMAKIDDIIGRFKDINANKIAIYSYNLDDGVDSFRKKRVSLNRAVEIRSYLIKQGYKNFSIKVININSGSDKVNTVELEEI